MSYIVGVDGGGTKTSAVISDTTGSIIGVGHSGPSNYHAVGLDDALRAILNAIASAARNARIGTRRFDATSLGLAGVGRESDRAVMLKALERRHDGDSEAWEGVSLGDIVLDHDAAIALAGATCGERGVIVLAGTGAIAFGENEKGERRRAGGWGHILDDEGSAHYIGQRILRAAFRSYDGRGPSTILTDKLTQHFRVRSIEDIVRMIYSPTSTASLGSGQVRRAGPQTGGISSKGLVASLARLADDAASAGDEVSAGILGDAAAELALDARVVIQGLGMRREEFTLAYSGGVFEGSATILSAFIDSVRNAAPKADICRAQFPPVVGALMLGLRGYGVDLTQEVQRRVRSSFAAALRANAREE